MLAFILRRSLLLLPRLIVVWLVVAVVIELAMVGPRSRGEAAGGQTLTLVKDLAMGELPRNFSASYGDKSVPALWREAIGAAAWASLKVSGMAAIIALAFGPIFGVMAGRFRRSPWIEVFLSPLFAAAWLPGFWLASLAVWWQVEHWGHPGYADAESASGGPVQIEWLWHTVLVAIPVALVGIGWQMRFIAGSLKRAASAPHVRGAFSRGMSGGALFYRHVFGNSLKPLVRSLDRSLPAMLGAQIVIEWALRYPGLGRLVVESARAPHFAGLLGGGLFFSALLVLAHGLGKILSECLSPASLNPLKSAS